MQTQINTNNLSNNEDNMNYHLSFFKQLIRFVYFKKELNSQNSSFKSELCKAYLINSKIINKLMQKYNINEIIPYLDNNALDGITYNNFDDNFCRISAFLDDMGMDKDYIIELNQFEKEIQFSEDEKSLITKESNFPIKFQYLNDFEIIDKKFMHFLKIKFNDVIMPLIHFGLIKDNNIFLIINLNEQLFYQIMGLNKDYNLSFNYLIEIEKDNAFDDVNERNNYIFRFLLNNKPKNLIFEKNPIRFKNDGLILNLYSNFYNSMQKKNRNIRNQKNYSYINQYTNADK